MATFKVKTEEILDLFISKNVIFLITLYNIIVLEIFSFKVIDIINNINPMNQVISFNFNDYIAYTKLKNKKKVYVKYYISENNKVVKQAQKIINFNFDYIQTIQLSPSGKVLALVSIYGNKIHLYYTENGELKECLLVSQYMETILKVQFSEKKSNYLLVLKNDNKFKVYKIGKEQEKNSACICHKYDDNNITIQNKEENNSGIFGYFKKYSKNKDIKDPHAFAEFEGNLLFFDFDI